MDHVRKQRRKKLSPETPKYPANVVNLARAFKAGKDCAFALHDALLESGLPGPATHFTGDHPCRPGMTCLVVQDILNPRPLDPNDPTAGWPAGTSRKPTRESILGPNEDLSSAFAEVCRDLECCGVAQVEVEYDGYGGSGAIEGVTLLNRAGAEVKLAKLVAGQSGGRAQASGNDLETRLDDLGYRLLPLGWENNAGAHGTILINTMTRRIRVDHVWRVEASEKAPYEFEL